MTNSVRESSDSRDGSLCESSLNNSPAERRERIARIIDPSAFYIPSHPTKIGEIFRLAAVQTALTKADAILSSDLVGTDQKKSIAQSDHQTEQSPTSQV